MEILRSEQNQTEEQLVKENESQLENEVSLEVVENIAEDEKNQLEQPEKGGGLLTALNKNKLIKAATVLFASGASFVAGCGKSNGPDVTPSKTFQEIKAQEDAARPPAITPLVPARPDIVRPTPLGAVRPHESPNWDQMEKERKIQEEEKNKKSQEEADQLKKDLLEKQALEASQREIDIRKAGLDRMFEKIEDKRLDGFLDLRKSVDQGFYYIKSRNGYYKINQETFNKLSDLRIQEDQKNVAITSVKRRFDSGNLDAGLKASYP